MSRRLDKKRVSNFQERTLNLIRRRQRGFDRCSLLKIDSYQKKGKTKISSCDNGAWSSACFVRLFPRTGLEVGLSIVQGRGRRVSILSPIPRARDKTPSPPLNGFTTCSKLMRFPAVAARFRRSPAWDASLETSS